MGHHNPVFHANPGTVLQWRIGSPLDRTTVCGTHCRRRGQQRGGVYPECLNEVGEKLIPQKEKPSRSKDQLGVSGGKSLTMSYFHTGIRTIIGAKSFHCPVRDGKEWYQLAMVIRHNFLTGCRNDNLSLSLIHISEPTR